MPPKGPSRGGPPGLEARSSSKAAGAPGAPSEAPGLPELDDAALDRLQQQILEDDEFADDMRALLLARFRAKHRKGRGPPGSQGFEEGWDASSEDNCESSGEDEGREPDPEDVRRLQELGYTLQPNERLLTRARKSSKHATAEATNMETEEDLPLCDQQGLLQKLEELKYDPPPGMRRVPFVETLAIVAEPVTADGEGETGETKETKAPIDAADDLKREAFFVQQVQKTVPIALARLRAVGLQFTRPGDFLAEMLKSDQQMGKIRARIEEEQQRQQQFADKLNRNFNKKFNKLSGHRIVREQEEARQRNLQLKAIEGWKTDRAKARREGKTNKEAEEDFDDWLLGQQQNKEALTPNHQRNFKQKQGAGGPPKLAPHKPRRQKGIHKKKAKAATPKKAGNRRGKRRGNR